MNCASVDRRRGCVRFAKSERGWPIVESSQSRRPMTSGFVGWKTYTSVTNTEDARGERTILSSL